jgi:hypothetical protein
VLGRYDEAQAHFEAALEQNARLRALPLLAHTQEELAAMLRERARPGDLERAEKLEDESVSLRAELSLGDAAERGGRQPLPPTGPADGFLAGKRGGWLVRFAGEEARVQDSRGLRYLALLLERPEQEIHVLDLVAQGTGDGEAPVRGAAAAEVVDGRARAEYRARMEALRAELDEAERRNDAGRAERAREELEAIERTLLQAYGLGGRSRRLGDPAERARKAVYNRLRGAIAQLGAAVPPLGRHLASSVRTGTFCAYRPEHPVRWRVERD